MSAGQINFMKETENYSQTLIHLGTKELDSWWTNWLMKQPSFNLF